MNKRAYGTMSGAEGLCTSGPTTKALGHEDEDKQAVPQRASLNEDAANLNATTTQAPSDLQ